MEDKTLLDFTLFNLTEFNQTLPHLYPNEDYVGYSTFEQVG